MSARIEISLEQYLAAGRKQPPERACFSCRRVSMPLPSSASEEVSGKHERRCGLCGAAAAVEIQRALREKWLTVLHEGQSLTDLAVRP